MQTNDAITKFETYVDDATELSSVQELALLQKIFNKVWSDRPWEFTKSSASGLFALTAPNIPLPANFSHFLENDQATDNTIDIDNNAAPKVIFITANYNPYQIINWSDRRQYRNRSNFAYLDLPNNGITFTGTPLAVDVYEFDFKAKPPILTLNEEIPGIPSEFHDMLYHGMAVDDEIIQRWPRATAYQKDNQDQYADFFARLTLWNANLQLN